MFLLALVAVRAAVASNLFQQQVLLHLGQEAVTAVSPAMILAMAIVAEVGFGGILVSVVTVAVAVAAVATFGLVLFVSTLGGEQVGQVALNGHGCS